jgi:hypothetical protein
MHEIMHALLMGHSFPKEETFVVILAEGLCQVIRDNPGLVEEMAKELSGPKKKAKKPVDKPPAES